MSGISGSSSSGSSSSGSSSTSSTAPAASPPAGPDDLPGVAPDTPGFMESDEARYSRHLDLLSKFYAKHDPSKTREQVVAIIALRKGDAVAMDESLFVEVCGKLEGKYGENPLLLETPASAVDPDIVSGSRKGLSRRRDPSMAAFLEAHDNPLSASSAPQSELPIRIVTATVKQDYTPSYASGLPVKAGDVVVVLRVEPEWALVRRSDDRKGWVPRTLLAKDATDVTCYMVALVLTALVVLLLAVTLAPGRCVWHQQLSNGECRTTATQVCTIAGRPSASSNATGRCVQGSTAKTPTVTHHTKKHNEKECSTWCTELGSACETAIFIPVCGDYGLTLPHGPERVHLSCAELMQTTNNTCKLLQAAKLSALCCTSCHFEFNFVPIIGDCYAYSSVSEAVRQFVPATTVDYRNKSTSWLCIPVSTDQDPALTLANMMQRLEEWIRENLHSFMSSIATLTRIASIWFKFTLRRVEDKILHCVGYGGAGSLFGTITDSRQAAVAARSSQTRGATGHDLCATSWDAIAAPSTKQSTTWTEARIAQCLTVRQALWSCGAKLLLWHWAQSLSYLYAFGYYYCELPRYRFELGVPQLGFLPFNYSSLQQGGILVAIREATYFGSTIVALVLNPAYLLMELGQSETKMDRALYFLAPHHYVTMCLTRWATKREDGVGSRSQQFVLAATYFIWWFQTACDYVSFGLFSYLVVVLCIHTGFYDAGDMLLTFFPNATFGAAPAGDSNYLPQPPFSLLIAYWLTSWGVILGPFDWGKRCWHYARRGRSRSVETPENPDTKSSCVTSTFGKAMLRLVCCKWAFLLFFIALYMALSMLIYSVLLVCTLWP